MTSSFLSTPKKCLQPDKSQKMPDPGSYQDGIERYREKYMNGANKTNLVQGKAERFKGRFDPD